MANPANYSKEVVQLYRDFLRASNGFENYNFRAYFIRRTKSAFRDSKITEFTPEMLSKARGELLVLQRQSRISNMYHFDQLVVEKKKIHN